MCHSSATPSLHIFFLKYLWILVQFPNLHKVKVICWNPNTWLLRSYVVVRYLQSLVHKKSIINPTVYTLYQYSNNNKIFNRTKKKYLERYETWSYCWRFSSSFKTCNAIKNREKVKTCSQFTNHAMI